METPTSHQTIASTYLHCFCAGDIDALSPLFTRDLIFDGPFHRFTSARDYLRCLHDDPPQPCGYRVLSLTENRDEVVLLYDYLKPRHPVRIAQRFRFRQQRISEILLIFDTREVS
ncbi:MAG: nuclear transport factor 2 family protein [Candidatus Thiodiazotropha sp. (ex Monitilora ramsayi)]|nr:nuclear transport factor 2 family protein [Candidatus Thiodiazotropha sp. (ex Monitilora ramsayi)]